MIDFTFGSNEKEDRRIHAGTTYCAKRDVVCAIEQRIYDIIAKYSKKPLEKVTVRKRRNVLFLDHWYGDSVCFRLNADGTLTHIEEEGFIESPYLTKYRNKIQAMIETKFIVRK